MQITDNTIQFLQEPTFMHAADLAPQSESKQFFVTKNYEFLSGCYSHSHSVCINLDPKCVSGFYYCNMSLPGSLLI